MRFLNSFNFNWVEIEDLKERLLQLKTDKLYDIDKQINELIKELEYFEKEVKKKDDNNG